MARARSSSPISENGTARRRRGSKSALGEAPAARHAGATSTATAGAEVRPGESKQATLKKPGASSGWPMTKSPSAHEARRPAKFAMTPREPASGHVRRAASSTNAALALVDTSSLLPLLHGVRPHQQVAVHGRRHEHALACARRRLEHGVREQPPGRCRRGSTRPPRHDAKATGAHGIVQPVGEHARRRSPSPGRHRAPDEVDTR